MMEKLPARVCAKLSGKNGDHKIVFTNPNELDQISFFDVPTDIESDKIIEYNPDAHLEEDEWFYIDLDDDHISSVEPYLKAANSTVSINPIEADDYMRIDAIYKLYANANNKYGAFVIQKITKTRKIVRQKILSFLNNAPKIEDQQNSIIVSNKIDAYYDGCNRIYFKNFTTIQSLFPGIEDYYREATREEMKSFCNCALISNGDDLSEKIGKRNRKRIAAIMSDATIKLDDGRFLSNVKLYALKYPEINLELDDNGRFILTNDKDVSNFILLVTGRYYTSEISGEKMAATTATKLEQPNTAQI